MCSSGPAPVFASLCCRTRACLVQRRSCSRRFVALRTPPPGRCLATRPVAGRQAGSVNSERQGDPEYASVVTRSFLQPRPLLVIAPLPCTVHMPYEESRCPDCGIIRAYGDDRNGCSSLSSTAESSMSVQSYTGCQNNTCPITHKSFLEIETPVVFQRNLNQPYECCVSPMAESEFYRPHDEFTHRPQLHHGRYHSIAWTQHG